MTVVMESIPIKEKELLESYFTLESHLSPGVLGNNRQWRLSSCESEFMAATAAACQALWLKRLLSELTGSEEKKITLKVDNVSAIALVKNPVFHGRSKHIDIRYHFIRGCVENGHGTCQRRTTKSRYSNKGSTKIEVHHNATDARSSRFKEKQRSRLRRRMKTE